MTLPPRGPVPLLLGSALFLGGCPAAPAPVGGARDGADGGGSDAQRDGATGATDGGEPAARDEPRWGKFAEPASCERCHPEHVREWSMSSHAYALVDPVFRALVRLGQEETDGALDQLCTTCHSPYGVKTRQTEIVHTAGVASQRLDVGPIAGAGVSCDVCHQTTYVARGNAALIIEPEGTRYGGIAEPVDNDEHPSAFGDPQKDARLCGSCHDVTIDSSRGPLRVESTFSEWVPVLTTGTCQECHMPVRNGPAAKDGPVRTLHDHRFPGIDVSLLPPDAFPGYHELRDAVVRELRERALELAVRCSGRTLVVTLQNRAGHALPSGATADRQLWIEVRLLRESGGVEVFSSGTLDARGDLRDDRPEHTERPGSDPQLVVFRQRLLDGDAEVHAVWQANAFEERLIPARGSVRASYDLSAVPAGSYRAEVRIRYRAFPPYLLRVLEERAGLDPDVRARLPVVDVAERTLTCDL